jgi:hypothetical protein
LLVIALNKAGQLAALGGIASKMGLASGPMVAAFMWAKITMTN